jgi:hypothetical protein
MKDRLTSSVPTIRLECCAAVLRIGLAGWMACAMAGCSSTGEPQVTPPQVSPSSQLWQTPECRAPGHFCQPFFGP